jgi:hypothetical protein
MKMERGRQPADSTESVIRGLGLAGSERLGGVGIRSAWFAPLARQHAFLPEERGEILNFPFKTKVSERRKNCNFPATFLTQND